MFAGNVKRESIKVQPEAVSRQHVLNMAGLAFFRHARNPNKGADLVTVDSKSLSHAVTQSRAIAVPICNFLQRLCLNFDDGYSVPY